MISTCRIEHELTELIGNGEAIKLLQRGPFRCEITYDHYGADEYAAQLFDACDRDGILYRDEEYGWEALVECAMKWYAMAECLNALRRVLGMEDEG